ncbi:MAG: putative selenium-dependent hydroxylase accessory protein YqeC [Caldilineaceae bacterium]|nr:putative selenium-dependent hydroxylase accessory protein YqeC [Caldilineaceae bacterium]
MDLLTALPLDLHAGVPHVISFVGGGGKSSALFGLAKAIADRGHRVISTSTTHLGAEQLALAPSVVRVTNNSLPLPQLAEALAQHNHCLLIGAAISHASDASLKTPMPAEMRLKGLPIPMIDELVNHCAQLGVSALLVEADGSKRRPIKAPATYEPAVPTATTMLITVMGLDAVGHPITEEFVHRPELLKQLLHEYSASSLPVEPAPPAPALDAPMRLTPSMMAHLLLHPNGGAKNLPPLARHVLLLNKAESPVLLAVARLIRQQFPSDAPLCLMGAVGFAPQNPIQERWAPLGIAVLAAGQSRRMGRSKQLSTADGEIMVVRAVRVALASGAEQTVVVTGAYAPQVEEQLRAALGADFTRLHLVHNPDWASGQASSVRCAIQNFAPHIAAAAIMPVDQPFLSPLLLKQIFQRWRLGAQMVAPAVQSQMRGAPALFDRTMWDELATVDGDVGARVVLRRYADAVSTVETSALQLQDIDTPEDLARLA